MSGLWRRFGVLGPAGLSGYGTTYVRPGVTEDGGMGHCRQALFLGHPSAGRGAAGDSDRGLLLHAPCTIRAVDLATKKAER